MSAARCPEQPLALSPSGLDQLADANGTLRRGIIIVDVKRPGHLAALRATLAHHPLIDVVPDLRHAERRRGRIPHAARERRIGPDRRRALPPSWTDLGVVVVPCADVAPPMEP